MVKDTYLLTVALLRVSRDTYVFDNSEQSSPIEMDNKEKRNEFCVMVRDSLVS